MKKFSLFSLAFAVLCACSSKDAIRENREETNDPSDNSVQNQAPSESEQQGKTNVISDAGTDATTHDNHDAGIIIVDLSTCLHSCEAAHPTGVKLGNAIDACWKEKCSPACTDDMVTSDGGTFLPDANSDGGTCKSEVRTPAAACSTCTVTKCCDAWDACFTNAECQSLNRCSVECYSKYSQ